MTAIKWLYKSPNRVAVALRTAVQTVLGVLVAQWFAAGDGRISTVPDVISAQIDLAAGSGLAAAIVALGWHARNKAA